MYSADYLKSVTKHLNTYLADINVLLIKIKNLHYNIEGVEFFEVHEHLDTYYSAVSEEIDEVAERIRMLDGRPDASMKSYLSHSSLKELEAKRFSYLDVCKNLIEDFTAIVGMSHKMIMLADDNNDAGTADLFTKTIQFYEKALWMLKSFSSNK